MDSGHTSWMLMATALVFFMTPGLAFFYGGLVRAKNLVNTIMMSFMSIAIVSIVWVLWGYSLAFGTGNAFIGDFSHLGLSGISFTSAEGDDIPPLLFVAFQMMFAVITPALITGAFAERFKFSTYLIFLVIWSTLVYSPITHWVWASNVLADGTEVNGWLWDLGALDFAGGTVIHINAGIAAVVAAMLVGKRRNPGLQPNNVPYVVLGAAILWLGWFGFNAGSAVQANDSAANAFLVTSLAASTAALTWGVISHLKTGKMGAVGVATGAVAGLVAITPAAGFVGPKGALAIGVAAGLICYWGATVLKHTLNYDDSFDVFAVHGLGGITGAILTGVFAVEAIGGTAGALEGNVSQIGTQIYGIIATIIWSAIATGIIILIIDKTIGIRVDKSAELEGLDLSQHGEMLR